VFQGRFKAIPVDKQNYLPALSRYVVMNPRVQDHIARQDGQGPRPLPPVELPATVGEVTPPPLLDTAALLVQFAATAPATHRTSMPSALSIDTIT